MFRIESQLAGQLSAVLAPNVLPRVWANEAPIELNHSRGTMRPCVSKKMQQVELRDRELVEEAFCALDEFAQASYHRCLAAVRVEQEQQRLARRAVEKAAKRARVEDNRELVQKMKNWARAKRMAWEAAQRRLRARVVHDLGLAKVPVVVEGYRLSGVLVRRAQEDARRALEDIASAWDQLQFGSAQAV